MYPRSYLKTYREKTFRFCHSKATITARPFQDIPGPKTLPIVGTLYKYLPFIGEYSFDRLHVAGAKKLAKYGPLVREEFVPGESTVWVFKPEDIAEVFKSEVGSYPERRSHLALLKYRKDRSKVYNTGGLLPTNGAEWWRIRKEFQKDLSKPRCIVNYVESTDQVVNEFVELCGRQKNQDLLSLLSRLFLELTCLVAFDVKFNSFSKQEMTRGSRSSKLIEAALTSNSVTLKLDNGPRLWRYFDTPLYKKMSNSQQYMEKVAVEMVSQKLKILENRENEEKESLLETYLKNPNLDVKDVVGMACDMLLAGIDTTSYSTSFALYHLARNLEAQEKLYKEAVTLIPNPDDSVTSTTLRNASYTKAAIKETFRLNPISVGVGRVLKNDVILSGYHVPKGTVVITQNQITCRLPEYFPEPDSYLPERWTRDNDNLSVKKPINPHLVLPFGHGTRSCIARRLAEQNMQIILLKIASLALIAVASAQQYASGQQQPPIAILRQAQDVAPDGSYNFNYETENGISAQESGHPGPVNDEGQAAVVAEGSFQYTAPDGTPISVSYRADENGFQPQGDHLPVAPPVPEGILRALEYNAAHPEQDESQPQQFNRKF